MNPLIIVPSHLGTTTLPIRLLTPNRNQYYCTVKKARKATVRKYQQTIDFET